MIARLQFVQKIGGDGEFSIQIEDIQIQELLQIHPGMLGMKDSRMRVQFENLLFQTSKILGADQIHFIDQDEVP